jgi:hypothetical protein
VTSTETKGKKAIESSYMVLRDACIQYQHLREARDIVVGDCGSQRLDTTMREDFNIETNEKKQ